jgi:NADPH-dependent 2,4-dienoyl-CoA reductase/sulfur reductase-like enzyme
MGERWRIEPDYAVPVDKPLGMLGVLLEPATVVAKAWEHILAIGRRTFWDPHTVLVVGAGPIGWLAALIGVQLGAEVHVLDRPPAARNRRWSSSWAGPTTPGRLPTWACTPTSWWSAPRGRTGLCPKHW